MLTLIQDKKMIATPIGCENIPQNLIELDPDSDDQYFYTLGPEAMKQKPLIKFKLSQLNTTIRPNTFTAQATCIYSNAELDQFCNRILFCLHTSTSRESS